ncbi:conserved domain protein [Trichinella spiralis]|uniref:hypothetical protein n=1 Tax=Trichinella spiralis TaxID=6334 RepID=UPI0001EFC051|nr:conserved domain protein [Trichinella spiralis]
MGIYSAALCMLTGSYDLGGIRFSFLILSTIEDQLVIFVVAPMPFVDVDRRLLITDKWRTNADIKTTIYHGMNLWLVHLDGIIVLRNIEMPACNVMKLVVQYTLTSHYMDDL